MDSNYKQFKSDCESMKVFDFMNKWKKDPKYEEYNQKNMMKISMNIYVKNMIMMKKR